MSKTAKNETAPVVEANTNVKLTREEMEKIQEIQSNSQNITFELGSIELQFIQLGKRKENVKAKLDEIAEVEKEFTNELFEKYGKGTVNLEKGEFIKDANDQ